MAGHSSFLKEVFARIASQMDFCCRREITYCPKGGCQTNVIDRCC